MVFRRLGNFPVVVLYAVSKCLVSRAPYMQRNECVYGMLGSMR